MPYKCNDVHVCVGVCVCGLSRLCCALLTDILAAGEGGDAERRPAIDMDSTFLLGSCSPWFVDAETTAVAVDTEVRNPS